MVGKLPGFIWKMNSFVFSTYSSQRSISSSILGGGEDYFRPQITTELVHFSILSNLELVMKLASDLSILLTIAFNLIIWRFYLNLRPPTLSVRGWFDSR